MSKYVIAVLMYFLNILSSCGHPSSLNNQPTIIRGPYLQQVTPGSIVIRWRTDIPSKSKVSYGKNLLYGKFALDTASTTEHVVKLNGLEPSTRYYYAIGSDSIYLQGDSLNHFLTAPSVGHFIPTRIWVTGDFGIGSQAQKDVRDSYKNYSSTTPTNLWIWLGDNAYSSGTDQEYQNYVFDIYPEQLKQYPLYPAPGNHDYGNAGYQSASSLTTNFSYFSIFTVPTAAENGGQPSGTPKYYSYNYSNIHFISLDSYGAFNHPGSPMYEWLAKDLSNNTQRWTIVYFHHPPYTKGTHDSDSEIELIDMRTHIIPLLESYKVDLVLSGHSHVNERSYLIQGHYGLSNSFDSSMMLQPATNEFTKQVPYSGTIYGVCGTSGQYVGPAMNDAPMPCMYFNDFTSNCSMVLDVEKDVLIGKYLRADGVILDEFTITKFGPSSNLNSASASCEISYHSGEVSVYLSCFSKVKQSFKAALFDAKGDLVMEFNNLPKEINSGYTVHRLSLSSLKESTAVYFVNVWMGNEKFTKKVLLQNTQ